jgi:hypothetical protein
MVRNCPHNLLFVRHIFYISSKSKRSGKRIQCSCVIHESVAVGGTRGRATRPHQNLPPSREQQLAWAALGRVGMGWGGMEWATLQGSH